MTADAFAVADAMPSPITLHDTGYEIVDQPRPLAWTLNGVPSDHLMDR